MPREWSQTKVHTHSRVQQHGTKLLNPKKHFSHTPSPSSPSSTGYVFNPGTVGEQSWQHVLLEAQGGEPDSRAAQFSRPAALPKRCGPGEDSTYWRRRWQHCTRSGGKAGNPECMRSSTRDGEQRGLFCTRNSIEICFCLFMSCTGSRACCLLWHLMIPGWHPPFPSLPLPPRRHGFTPCSLMWSYPRLVLRYYAGPGQSPERLSAGRKSNWCD